MLIHYQCNRCDLFRDMSYLPRVYLLPDQSTVPMTQRHGWCSTCQDISPFESLERNPSELDTTSQMIAGHERKLALNLTPEEISRLPRHERFSPQWERQCLEEHRQFEKKWELWRSMRLAPEKCLRCGSSPLNMPVSDWCDLLHPGCGGTISSPADIWSHNGPEVRPHLYSIDGELLDPGEKPIRIGAKMEYVALELFWN